VNLYINYPALPPSSNHIYVRTRFGLRLTKIATKYAEDFSYHVVRMHLPEINEMNKSGVFALHLKFFFPSLLNDGAFKEDPKKRSKTLYKKIDISNRVKLLEDCIRDALSIDDSQTFAASQEKYQDSSVGESGRVQIIVQELDPLEFGLPDKGVLSSLMAGLRKDPNE
jgi:Holliday junction resolvase RusA-like endonuclease